MSLLKWSDSPKTNPVIIDIINRLFSKFRFEYEDKFIMVPTVIQFIYDCNVPKSISTISQSYLDTTEIYKDIVDIDESLTLMITQPLRLRYTAYQTGKVQHTLTVKHHITEHELVLTASEFSLMLSSFPVLSSTYKHRIQLLFNDTANCTEGLANAKNLQLPLNIFVDNYVHTGVITSEIEVVSENWLANKLNPAHISRLSDSSKLFLDTFRLKSYSASALAIQEKQISDYISNYKIP